MKKSALLFCIFYMPIVNTYAQDLWADFEKCTFHGYANSEGITDFLTIEENISSIYGSKYLKKNCDGSVTPIGEMAITRKLQKPTSYNICNEINCLSRLDFILKNSNDFDLHLKIGIKDINGNRVIYESFMPEIVKIPALSDWNIYNFSFENSPAHLDVSFDFTQVIEFKLFHNTSSSPSYFGEFIEGTFEIDEISPYFLLTDEDSNERFKECPPNSAKAKVTATIKLLQFEYCLYDITGKVVDKGNFIPEDNFQIEKNALSPGLYFIETITDRRKEIHVGIKS